MVGESGFGKTTLLRFILGLVLPTEGQVTFDGRLMHANSKKDLAWLRTQVGFVQQDPYGALAPFMTVTRILTEPLVVNKVAKDEHDQRIREALEEVRLIPVEDFMQKYPHMLSGGQQQRLVIARALILRPRLIVADEPVSMLDASVRVEILELIKAIQQHHNLGVIYVTHDFSSVRYFSERVFVMYAAKLVEKVNVNEIVHNPLHPYAQALLKAIPDPEPENLSRFREVPSGEPPNLINPPRVVASTPVAPALSKGYAIQTNPPNLSPAPATSSSAGCTNRQA